MSKTNQVGAREWNEIADKTSVNEMIKEVKATYKNSTKVVGWYSHTSDVRGPYCRWLTVSDVLPEYEKHVGTKYDDAIYIANAMNYAPKLAVELEVALQALIDERKRVEDLIKRLNNALWFQEKAKEFISHFDDCNALTDELEDDEPCICGMDKFAHDNFLSIQITNTALTLYNQSKESV